MGNNHLKYILFAGGWGFFLAAGHRWPQDRLNVITATSGLRPARATGNGHCTPPEGRREHPGGTVSFHRQC